ncbi:Putative uncharacterized protein [Moritella viscosa]|uniref:GNAT family N-acetyltransferase n=1 Tax=Moritella viscosa TaxID=80854 RepID=UPI00091891B4|nr:GNAT family N-acetyltransferase [Moritella viscosa]SGY94534.1 Putative uncharacterized protein [Moritella viscosa]
MAVGARFLKESEYEWWDKFVDSSQQGFIFSKSWWLESVTSGDFKICIFEGDNEILAGMPLPFFNEKRIRMPPLTQSLGVLFLHPSNTRIQKQLTNQKEHTRKIYEFIRGNISDINLNFHYNYTYWSPLYWEGFKQTTRYTFCIDYKNFDENEYFKSFSKGHKWTLNKVAKKSDLIVEELTDLSFFYSQAKKTYERQNIEIGYSFEFLKVLDDHLSRNNARKMFKISDADGNVHAVNYIIYDNNEAYYFLGASDVDFRKSGAHTYLIWYVIKYFSEQVNLFNFGGSMLESVEKNFRNFSANQKPYYVIKKNESTIKNKIKDIVKIIIGQE